MYPVVTYFHFISHGLVLNVHSGELVVFCGEVQDNTGFCVQRGHSFVAANISESAGGVGDALLLYIADDVVVVQVVTVFFADSG